MGTIKIFFIPSAMVIISDGYIYKTECCIAGAMIEIEVKILEINRDSIEQKLIALGAHKTFDGEIHAIYYDLPGDSLRNSGKTLRLRKEGKKNVLTLKLHISSESAKEQEEYESEVGDFEGMKIVLEGLGYIPWLEMKKHRLSYAYSDAHVDLDEYHDQYSFIPPFMEIEGKDLNAIYLCAEALGFSRHDCKPWDAVKLAEYYRGKE